LQFKIYVNTINYLGFFRFIYFFFIEDSMNDIRHQAMIELQKLVLAAENKMIELVAAERTKMSGGNCRSSAATASLQISPSLISQYNVSRVRFVGLKSVCSDETIVLCARRDDITYHYIDYPPIQNYISCQVVFR